MTTVSFKHSPTGLLIATRQLVQTPRGTELGLETFLVRSQIVGPIEQAFLALTPAASGQDSPSQYQRCE